MSTVRVSVDGRAVDVPAGAPVVVALVQAAVLCTRRSVRGERRFAFCGMGVCQECRVSIDGEEQQLACRVRCADGMRIDTGEGQ